MNVNDRLFAILAEMKTFNDEDYHKHADELLCEVITILTEQVRGEAETVSLEILAAYNSESFPKWYA